eukprot:sb/3463935/
MSGNNFVGSKISLISKAGIRYLGTLVDINASESTVALKNVMSFGTENRPCPTQYPPSKTTYNYVKFRGTDIADLHVFEQSQPQDPAIIEAQQGPPPNGHMMGGEVGGTPSEASPAPTPAASGFNSSFSPNNSFNNQGNNSGTFVPFGQGGNAAAPTPANSFQEGNVVGNVDSAKPASPGPNKEQEGKQEDDREEGNYNRGGRGRNAQRKNSYNNRRHTHREGMPFTNKTLSFESDFDFASANSKFDKNELEKELRKFAKLSVSDEPEVAAAEPSGEESENNNAAPGSTGEDPDDKCYDKATSFFDTISCEALEKEKGERRRPPNWHQEKQLNSETFGEGVSTYRSRSYQGNSYRGRDNNYGGGDNRYYNNNGGYNNNRYGRSDNYYHGNRGGGYRNNRHEGYSGGRDGGYNNNRRDYNSYGNGRDFRDSRYNNSDGGYRDNRAENTQQRQYNSYNNDHRGYDRRDNREQPRRNYYERSGDEGRSSYRRVDGRGHSGHQNNRRQHNPAPTEAS